MSVKIKIAILAFCILNAQYLFGHKLLVDNFQVDFPKGSCDSITKESFFAMAKKAKIDMGHNKPMSTVQTIKLVKIYNTHVSC